MYTRLAKKPGASLQAGGLLSGWFWIVCHKLLCFQDLAGKMSMHDAVTSCEYGIAQIWSFGRMLDKLFFLNKIQKRKTKVQTYEL